jgi:hypothetical protein
VLDNLVRELGRAVGAVHLADRDAPGAPLVLKARSSIAQAAEALGTLAHARDIDLEIVARAWECIAVAHDAAGRARQATAEARQQMDAAFAVKRDAEVQGRRARDHAQRIRRASDRKLHKEA